MKPVFQTKRGLGGNCLAACLASIFETSLDQIPDLAPPECFTDWSVQPRLRRKWLWERGVDYLEIDTTKAHYWTQGAIPEGLCLFSVESPSPEMKAKGYGHFVVGEIHESGEEIRFSVLHDPLGPLSANYTITAVGFFIVLHPERATTHATPHP